MPGGTVQRVGSARPDNVLYRRAVQVADIARIVEARIIRNMGDATIVPEREVADRPIAVIDELRMKTVLEQFLQYFYSLSDFELFFH
jgi:hypothetical protein